MKKVVHALFIGLFLVIIANLGMNAWLARHSNNLTYKNVNQLPVYPCALVLGTVKYNDKGEVYHSYANRIDAAALLYKSGKVKYLLVSSDNSRGYGYNAATMKKDLLQKGIPANKVVVDTGGVRTISSIIRGKNIFGLDSVIIVSQLRHCQRALYIARHFKLNAIAFVAPTGDAYTALGNIYHEQAARFIMLYDLYIRKVEN